jgi:hypothetical protein
MHLALTLTCVNERSPCDEDFIPVIPQNKYIFRALARLPTSVSLAVLGIPGGHKMLYDECLRLHFHFCLRMYVSAPPQETDVRDLREAMGL